MKNFIVFFVCMCCSVIMNAQNVYQNTQYGNKQLLESYNVTSVIDGVKYDISMQCIVKGGHQDWYLVVDAPNKNAFVNQIHIETANSHCICLEHPVETNYISNKERMAVVHGTATKYTDPGTYKRSIFYLNKNDIIQMQQNGFLNMSLIDMQHNAHFVNKKGTCNYMRSYFINSYNNILNVLI